MTAVEISSYIIATVAALSRLLKSAEPFWRLMPQKVAVIIPSVIAMIPVLVEQLGVAETALDLVNALLVAGALLLPGAGVKTDATDPEKPKVE